MNKVVNSTVISNFASVQRLDLLRDTASPLFLPLEVYNEIQDGIAAGYTFYEALEKKIYPFAEDGWLHLVTLSEAELVLLGTLPRRLHSGEAACLCLARHRGWGFLTDDRAARSQARNWGIPFSGTLGVLVLAIQDGRLTVEDGNTLLRGMVERANYRSPVDDLQKLLP